MSYNCPYCSFTFEKSAVKPVLIKDVVYYHCPNKEVEENDGRPCGELLPNGFFEAETISISLIGGTNVGKTYYYLALLNELINNSTLEQLGISGDILGGPKANPKLSRLVNQLNKGIKVESTSDIKTAVRSIIDLKISNAKANRHIYLTFHDSPGEMFSDQKKMVNDGSNVHKADALIFLMEPKQIKNFWRSIVRKNDYFKHNELHESDSLYTVLNNVTDFLLHVRNHQPKYTIARKHFFSRGWPEYVGQPRLKTKRKRIFGNKKLTKPVAMSISKYDQIIGTSRSKIPIEQSDLEYHINIEGGFDFNLLSETSKNLRDQILAYPNGESAIAKLLENNYSKHSYFAFKSIDVDENGEPEHLNPQGVLLPLIWILSELKLFKNDY